MIGSLAIVALFVIYVVAHSGRYIRWTRCCCGHCVDSSDTTLTMKCMIIVAVLAFLAVASAKPFFGEIGSDLGEVGAGLGAGLGSIGAGLGIGLGAGLGGIRNGLGLGGHGGGIGGLGLGIL